MSARPVRPVRAPCDITTHKNRSMHFPSPPRAPRYVSPEIISICAPYFLLTSRFSRQSLTPSLEHTADPHSENSKVRYRCRRVRRLRMNALHLPPRTTGYFAHCGLTPHGYPHSFPTPRAGVLFRKLVLGSTYLEARTARKL